MLVGPSMSNTQMIVEPQAIVAPSLTNFSKLSKENERVLIEEHATAHWGFTTSEAWFYYQSSSLTITEIVQDELYLLAYDGGILEVSLDDSNI